MVENEFLGWYNAVATVKIVVEASRDIETYA